MKIGITERGDAGIDLSGKLSCGSMMLERRSFCMPHVLDMAER